MAIRKKYVLLQDRYPNRLFNVLKQLERYIQGYVKTLVLIRTGGGRPEIVSTPEQKEVMPNVLKEDPSDGTRKIAIRLEVSTKQFGEF